MSLILLFVSVTALVFGVLGLVLFVQWGTRRGLPEMCLAPIPADSGTDSDSGVRSPQIRQQQLPAKAPGRKLHG